MLSSIVLLILVANPVMAASDQATAIQPTCAQTGVTKPWRPAGVLPVGAGVTTPRLVREVKPNCTRAAMHAGIEGRVGMEAVVGVDGTVGEVCVTHSLDREHGLDDEAARSMKLWRFEAGKKDGAAVPVVVEIEMTFALRKQK